jgi:hypothetical protein
LFNLACRNFTKSASQFAAQSASQKGDLHVRIFIGAMAAIAFACVSTSAYAQGKGGHGRQQQPTAQSAEALEKKKAEEKAYQDALKKIPVSTEKIDPWKNMR